MSSKLKIMRYLADNPGWHYGTEIREATEVWITTVYASLVLLEDYGLVEKRPGPPENHPGLTRPQYRSKLDWRLSESETDDHG